MTDEEQPTATEYTAALERLAVAIAIDFHANSPNRLRTWRESNPGFLDRFKNAWGTTLDAVELLIADSIGFGSRFNERHRPQAALDHDYRFEAIVRLHGKACQVALECLALLRAGLPAGAMARWRTLHETTVVALLLAKTAPEVSRRYLLHVSIAAHKIGKEFSKHREKLRHEAPSPQELAELAAQVEALKLEFGDDFVKSDYGWCADVLANKRPSMFAIEDFVGLGHWHPLYVSACIPVHAASRSLSTNLGAPDGEHLRSIVCGFSMLGIDTAGGMVLHSLSKVTSALFVTREDEDPSFFATEYGVLRYLGERVAEVERMLVEVGKRLGSLGSKNQADDSSPPA